MQLSNRAIGNFVVVLTSLFSVAACVPGDGEPGALSSVQSVNVPVANATAQVNTNISTPTLTQPMSSPIVPGQALVEVWGEEFEDGQLDPETWFFASGDGSQEGLPSGWGNNELQYYLPDNAQIGPAEGTNAKVDNGVLKIIAKRESIDGFGFTSARINTKDRFAIQYGKVEASIKMPAGQGLWPAFWMLPQDDRYGGWAASGEIDIVEAINLDGTGGNNIFGTIHYGGEFPNNLSSGVTYDPGVDVTESFNTYAIEWDEFEIRWYFNDTLYATQNSWSSTAAPFPAPFDQPFHILLNLAVGGNFPGSPTASTQFPAVMEIDWVRVYSGGGATTGTKPMTAAATPTQSQANVTSLFSDAYTDVVTETWPTSWSDATVSDVTIDGGTVKEHTDLQFVGIEFASLDASGNTHLHLDVWTPDADSLVIKLVDFGGDGFGGGNDTEGAITYDAASTPALAKGSWVSLDIPLAAFQTNGLGGLSDLNQMILDTGPNDDGAGTDIKQTLYVDNVYFYNDSGSTGGGGTAAVDFETSGTGSGFTWAVFENSDNPALEFVSNPDTSGINASSTVAKFTARQAGQPFAGTITSDLPTFTLDASNSTVTIMVYKSVISDVGIKFENGAGGSTGDIKVANTLINQWEELTFDFSGVIGDPNNTDITGLVVFPDFGARASDNVIYFDNIVCCGSSSGSSGSGGTGGNGGTTPASGASAPTQAEADVVSLFSDAYTDQAAEWPTSWSDAGAVTDVTVDGGLVKEHLDVQFFGIQLGASLDAEAAGLTHLHVDVWTPDADSLLIKLVDFGGNGGPGAASEGALLYDASSTPALVQGSWVSLDIPLSDFTSNGLASLKDLNQLVIDTGPNSGVQVLYIDNLYFYNANGSSGGTTPASGASAPTQAEADVVSLFSDAYTDQAAEWPTSWSDAGAVTDVTVDGGLVKEHLDVQFFGIQLGASLDAEAAGLTHLHVDVWTPDADSLLIKLVDFGGNGGPGAASEGALLYDASSTPALVQGSWVSLDIPLSDFTSNGLASLKDLNQLVIDTGPNSGVQVLYIDNLYFYNANGSSGGTTPASGASAPTQAEADVVSLFSDAYTDQAAEWPTSWSDAGAVTDVTVDGGLVKEHLDVQFFGIQLGASLDAEAAGLTHLHVDVWTPDADSLLIKLVDFGGNGGPGAASEGALLYDASSTPALVQGSWVSLDIPLSDFTSNGLASLKDLNQLVIDTGPNSGVQVLYIDNLYFYNANGSSGGTTPASGASAPTQAEADVVSLFSDAYTDQAAEWPTSWSDAGAVTDVTVDGGLVKEHLDVQFFGIQLGASLDAEAAGLTHLHVDVWTPDADSLLIKLVDFGGNGGPGAASEGALLYDASSTPALVQGSWVSLDIPLSDFTSNGLASLKDLNQLVIDTGPNSGVQVLYIDNLYFYNANGSSGGALVANGDFETGDFTGWETIANGGTIVIASGSGSTSAANLNAPPGKNPVLKQTGIGFGEIGANQQVSITFDWKGSASAGGVVDIQLFSETADPSGGPAGGVTKADTVLTGGTFPADWTTVGPQTFTTGSDTSGGLTLQIVAICGGDAGCVSDLFIDNITITSE